MSTLWTTIKILFWIAAIIFLVAIGYGFFAMETNPGFFL